MSGVCTASKLNRTTIYLKLTVIHSKVQLRYDGMKSSWTIRDIAEMLKIPNNVRHISQFVVSKII